MKHLLILGLLLLLSTTSWCQDTWVKTFGGAAKQMFGLNGQQGYYIDTDSHDNILITGETTSNDGDFEGLRKGGESDNDIFVIKLGKDGSIVWKKVFGGSQDDRGRSITATSDDGVLITGYTKSNDGDFEGMNKGIEDIFVIKLDKDGRLLWKHVFGGTERDKGWSITTTSDDGVLLMGETKSEDGDFEGLSKGPGNDLDVFVIKLDKDGKILWKKLYGGSKYDVSRSIATTPDDGFLITGETNSEDGDVTGVNKGNGDLFVIKLDKDGSVLWTKRIGGTNDEWSDFITSTSDGGSVITGMFRSRDGDFEGMFIGDVDIHIIKLDKDGTILWKKVFGGSDLESGSSITTTSDNGILVTGLTRSYNGDFEGLNKGQCDVFVIKLDNDGRFLWMRTFGGTNTEQGESIVTTTDGNILITGGCLSIDGDFPKEEKGFWKIFVMKLDSNGKLNQATSVNEQTSTSTPLLVTPNPLSTSSTIHYNLEAPSLVRIELMNTLGQVVDVLFDEYSESGNHRLPLNVSSLTSGMYSVRMISDKGAQTTQVCVVR